MRRLARVALVGLLAFGAQADGLVDYWDPKFWNPAQIPRSRKAKS